jgi:hypothetical protein
MPTNWQEAFRNVWAIPAARAKNDVGSSSFCPFSSFKVDYNSVPFPRRKEALDPEGISTSFAAQRQPLDFACGKLPPGPGRLPGRADPGSLPLCVCGGGKGTPSHDRRL